MRKKFFRLGENSMYPLFTHKGVPLCTRTVGSFVQQSTEGMIILIQTYTLYSSVGKGVFYMSFPFLSPV